MQSLVFAADTGIGWDAACAMEMMLVLVSDAQTFLPPRSFMLLTGEFLFTRMRCPPPKYSMEKAICFHRSQVIVMAASTMSTAFDWMGGTRPAVLGARNWIPRG